MFPPPLPILPGSGNQQVQHCIGVSRMVRTRRDK